MSDFFKYKTVNFDKLTLFGFEKQGENYVYSVPICDGQFNLCVTVNERGEVSSKTTDAATGDEYTLHLVESAEGAFVGEVRSCYEAVLQEISEKCFERDVFKEDCSHAVLEYVRGKYGDELQFLWENLSDSAVLRRKDNDKWYAVFMIVERRKLGLNEGGKVEIIDLRADTEFVGKKIDGKSYFPAYHMNKKHWLTVRLDGSVAAKEICARLDISYVLAGNKKR